jgi:WD40 repeat protein
VGSSNKKPLQLFISYAHSDGAEVASHLHADLEAAGFEVWWDKERLLPGASWTSGIETAIDDSEVVIALLSKGSYHSDICRAEQLRALRKHKRVLPIVLQQDADLPLHLESEQYLPFYQDEYAKGLNRLLGAIANDTLSASLTPRYKKRYRTYPPLPLHFVSRSELLASLRSEIIKEGDERCVAVTAIRGMGGIGKTVLAQAICHDEAIQDAFPDGVMWVTVGEKPSSTQLREQIREIAKALGENLEGYDSLYGCENQLRTALSNKSVLIVLDDVWDPRHVRYFWADAPRCRLLITTRSQEVVRGTGAQEFPIGVMKRDESLQLLARKSGLKVAELPVEATAIIRECGSLPLGLAMLGARVGKMKSEWARVLLSLREGRAHAISLKLADYRFSDLFEAIQMSVQSLKPEHRTRYHDLAVFRPDTPIPEAVLRTFWETDELDTDDTIAAWITASLANRDEHGQITLHDLQVDYVRRRAKNIKNLHLQLLQGYKRERKNGWESGPHDGYYFRWLAYHMQEAGEVQELRLLLSNPEWIRARLEDQNITGLIDDFEFVSFDPNLRLIQQALQLSLSILTRDARQLASQLFGRLRWSRDPVIQNFLTAIRNTQREPWLEPIWASLWRPGSFLLFTLAGHSREINAVAIVPGGKRVISGSSDFMLKIWDIEYGHEIQTLKGHSGSISGVAVTPDGQHAISSSHDGTLKIWCLENGTLVRTLQGHHGKVTSLILAPDGRRVVSLGDDDMIKTWDIETGQELYTMNGHEEPINVLSITPDGHYVLSASDDHTIKMWELTTGRHIRTLAGHTGPVNAIVPTPDGQTLLSGSDDATVAIWDLRTGAQIQALSGHNAGIAAIAIAPNSQWAVSASFDTTLKVWDLQTGEELHKLTGHMHLVNVVTITKDGTRIISASPDNTVKIWETSTGTELRSLTAHSGAVKAVLISPDGSRAISFSEDATIRVWKTGTELRDHEGHSHMVRAIAIAQQGRSVLSASFDKTLNLYDLETGAHICKLTGHTGPVIALAVTSGGEYAISASGDKTLKLWDLRNCRELHTLSGHSEPATSVLFTPDEKLAVSASYDRTIKIWDTHTGQELKTLSGHGGALVLLTSIGMKTFDLHIPTQLPGIERSTSVTQLCITPDGQRIVSACCDKTIKVWDLASGRELHSLTGHTDWITALLVTENGRMIISAALDNTIRMWDLELGKELNTLTAHNGTINQLVLCPRENRLLSVSADCTLKLWNFETVAPISTLEGHTAPVNAAAMTADSTIIYSVSDDHTMRAWKQNGEIAAFSADGSILCLARCKDTALTLAGDFLGRIHLIKFHAQVPADSSRAGHQ